MRPFRRRRLPTVPGGRGCVVVEVVAPVVAGVVVSGCSKATFAFLAMFVEPRSYWILVVRLLPLRALPFIGDPCPNSNLHASVLGLKQS